MFSPEQYQLIDFGRGRRLEQFAGRVLDRPCPAAEDVERADPGVWQSPDARFQRHEGNKGHWKFGRVLPRPWNLSHGPVTFELRTTPAGQLGVFPEQAKNWDWIAEQVHRAPESPRVLNLFAYTGGSTLAAAAAGADAVHVDAAHNMVAWARRNADLSGMAERPIRWITDDAMKFARRELKRGNRYDGVILDPPSYGHGPGGQPWQVSRHLPELLEMCGRLTDGRRRFILLTCHTPGFDAKKLKEMMVDALGREGTLVAGTLSIRSKHGHPLRCGTVARWKVDQEE